MASVFWDSKGVILVDYIEKGKTVNSVYYYIFLHRLREAIKEKRPGMLRKSFSPPRQRACSHIRTIDG